MVRPMSSRRFALQIISNSDSVLLASCCLQVCWCDLGDCSSWTRSLLIRHRGFLQPPHTEHIHFYHVTFPPTPYIYCLCGIKAHFVWGSWGRNHERYTEVPLSVHLFNAQLLIKSFRELWQIHGTCSASYWNASTTTCSYCSYVVFIVTKRQQNKYHIQKDILHKEYISGATQQHNSEQAVMTADFSSYLLGLHSLEIS